AAMSRSSATASTSRSRRRARSIGMNRGHLAIGAAVVLAALFGLLVALRSGDDAATSASPTAKPAKPDAKIAQADPGKPSVAPTRAPSANDTPAEPTAPVKEYVIGDVRVRDHRSGDHPPLDVAPAIHAPVGRKIPSELVY